MHPAVYVLGTHRLIPERKVPQFFHLVASRSVDEAHLIARTLREVFGCAAWVEDFYQPASTYSMKLLSGSNG